MRKQKNRTSIMGATIKNIIVAFLYVVIIYIIIYLLFSSTISKAISLIDMISVKTTQEVLKDVKIDLTTKDLESYPEYGTKYATIKIPSLNIDLPLYYGSKLSILKYGVGQSSGSYFPGEGGSILCMGHNTHDMLRKLPEIKNGAKIIIETTYGVYTYEVYNTKVVKKTQTEEAPIQREKEILMLYTCYPANCLGYTQYRFFAYANLIEESH